MMNAQILKKIEKEHYKDIKASSRKQHWGINRDADDFLWLDFDKNDASANTIGEGVLEELDEILSEAEKDLPKALVIRSMKKGGFCAGADIKQFQELDENGMRDMLSRGHKVLDRLEKFPRPTIAVIHGHCLGGGLELALACKFRIGIKGNLQMGFPEVQLGVHPGLGGTFRLTNLIDPTQAMTMMLTGKPAFNGQTKKRGLVDELVEERHVEKAVQAAANGDMEPHDQDFKDHAMNTLAARKVIAHQMRKKAEEKAPSKHYSAPYALIDLWEEYGGDRDEMQQNEIKSFAKLVTDETAQNLIRVFFLRQSLKDLAKKKSGISHVHVIGAGAMGGDIAGWCAMQGMKVTLSDQKTEPVGKAIKNTQELCKNKHKSSIETRDTLDRLIPDLNDYGLKNADLVIEAVPENLDIKTDLYKRIEPLMKKGAILATNTSSIPLDDLAKSLKRPASFIGLHFFNPVSKMMIVEIVSHDKTAQKAREDALSFVGKISKLPAPVSSYPGFLVNRALTPYLLEAILLMDEGVKKEKIDKAAEDFGMPMGPITLIDQVGLDICQDVSQMLQDKLDKPIPKIPDWLAKKVEEGKLGKKTGEGLYKWEDGKPKKDDVGGEDLEHSDITDRLILPMLNACVECYREGVIDDLDQLDGAMIFATGFAPFRGGPIHYARQRGINDVISSLEKLSKKHGKRFEPDMGWQDI